MNIHIRVMFGLLLFCSISMAGDKETLVRTALDVTGVDQWFIDTSEPFKRIMLKELGQQSVSQDAINDVSNQLDELFDPTLGYQAFIKAYTKAMTEDDLQQVIQWYQSAEGKQIFEQQMQGNAEAAKVGLDEFIVATIHRPELLAAAKARTTDAYVERMLGVRKLFGFVKNQALTCDTRKHSKIKKEIAKRIDANREAFRQLWFFNTAYSERSLTEEQIRQVLAFEATPAATQFFDIGTQTLRSVMTPKLLAAIDVIKPHTCDKP